MRSRIWVAWTVAAIGLQTSQVAAQNETPSETPVTVFRETPGAYLTTELVSTSVYELQVTFAIYFKGSATTAILPTGKISKGGMPVAQRLGVARVADVRPVPIELLACADEVCRPLCSELYAIKPLDAQVAVSLREMASLRKDSKAAGQSCKPLRPGEDVRLIAPTGWARLDGATGATLSDSPALSVVMPRLGDADSQFLGGRPAFRFKLAPVTKDQKSDQGLATSLSFEGAVNRFRPRERFGVTWSGDVSTKKELAFNNLKANVEWERNLWPRDFLPLVVSGGAESDQGFNLTNAILGARAEFLIPLNANFSPHDDGYIVNTGPLIEARAEAGWKAADDSSDAAAKEAPKSFRRAGYAVRWKLPVARDTVLRLHHAGLWVFAKDATDFHPLWDLAVETKIGNITYFVGYQRGEAAPLYAPIETTQAGLSIRFK